MAHAVLNVNKGKIPHNKYGDVDDLSCQIICLSPHGTSDSYKDPTDEDLEEQTQYLTDWEIRINYPKTRHAVAYESFARSGGSAALFTAPNILTKSNGLRAYGQYWSWLFFIDDLMDALKVEEPLTTTYEAVSKDIDVFTSVLDGEIDCSNLPEPVSTLGCFKDVCRIMQDIHDNLKDLPAFAKKENRKYFIKSVNDFIHSFLWNFDRKDFDHTSEFVFTLFRSYCNAPFSIFEFLAILNNVDWSQIDREALEFRVWMSTVSNAFAISNDVLSFRKEVGEGERENLAIHRHLNSGISINKAIHQVIAVLNSELHDVKVYGDRLLARNPSSEVLKTLVQVAHWMLDGHLHWYGYNKRHGGMALDRQPMSEEERHKIVHGHKKKHDHHKHVGAQMHTR